MKELDTPSQTALFSAAARAAHPLVDREPHLLDDVLARRLSKKLSPSPLDYQLAQPGAPILAAARLSACARSRYAETVLSEAGIDQVVVIGAGLDTTASRLPPACRDRVWLVDRPGVLAWRSRVFAQARVPDPARHVAADLADGLDLSVLGAAGLDLQRPVIVIWLGVSMYLHPTDCRRFFSDLSDVAESSVLVFDYHLAPELRDGPGADYAKAVAAMAGREGEPWRCSSTPRSMRSWLAGPGWRVQADIDEVAATPAGFFDRQEYLRPMRLVRLVRAVR